MSIRCYSDKQFPPNSRICVNLRHPNLPILENIYHLPIKQSLLTKVAADKADVGYHKETDEQHEEH
jgi:hypothetical protein